METVFEVPLPTEQWLGLLPDAAIISDQSGRILKFNPKTLELFGYQSDELIHKPIELLIPGRLHGKHAEHQRGFFRQPYARPMGRGMELFAQRKDGTEFPVEISISPMKAEGQTLVWAIIRDISDRKKAEAELREREARLQLIFDSTSELEVLYRVEPGDRIVVEMINQAMHRNYMHLVGRDATEFIGRDLNDFLDAIPFPPGEKEFRLSLFRQVLREKTPVQYTGSAGPGAQIAEATLKPVLNESGECTHLLWNARVVTEKIRAEAELREREQRLRMVFKKKHIRFSTRPAVSSSHSS